MVLLHQEMPANYCALTFDDGPGPHTAGLLDLLAERGIVATFFVLGQNAERRPSLIKRMVAEGHEVGNHSYSHANMRRLKPETQWLEMKRTQEVLHSLGAEVRYFRPPYGNYTPQTAAKAKALGMTIMLWSLDSQDWKRHVSRLEGLRSVAPVAQQSFPGMRGVFLFHDTHKHTVEGMADILDTLILGGCDRFVTVSEYVAKAPRAEGQRLATQAPNEGRGEMPPASLAVQQQPLQTNDVLSRLPEDTQSPRMAGVSIRTLAAHPVQARNQDGAPAGMRAQPAHGRPLSAAAPETLMAGIVTDERAAAATRQARPVNPAPLSLARAAPSATRQPRAPLAVQAQIPRPLFSPGLTLPAHRPNKARQNIRRDENGPG